MAYVPSILHPGEAILYQARFSWVGYLPGLILLIIPPIGLFLLVTQWIRRTTTEIVVTDRRLVYKTELISRQAVDVERSRIETVNLRQSVVGRLLDFGSITIHGTGMGEIALDGIDAPVEFRRMLA